MIDELEEIKRRKLEQLKMKYMDGGKKMEENLPDVPLVNIMDTPFWLNRSIISS